MTGIEIGLVTVVAMMVAIYLGIQIPIALMLSSFLGIAWLRSPELAARMAAGAAQDTAQDYLFAVVPLFVLMGLVITIADVGRDGFDVAQRLFRRMRGGIGVATVGANAVFASVTGISIASASIFTRIAVPEMVRRRYRKRFAVGLVASSSIIGMLIPPSLLMIVYGIVAEVSIGKMFIAGILPGLLVTLLFALQIVWLAHFRPDVVFEAPGVHDEEIQAAADELEGGFGWMARRLLPIAFLIVVVLGGIYGGVFTPTEAAAMGLLGSIVIAVLRRRITLKGFWSILVETGRISSAVFFLIIAASLYSRMLALTGLPGAAADFLATAGLGPYGFLLCYVVLIIALGCLIDSISIMLIVLPVALPVAAHMGMDPIWFGIVTILAVEIGLITPPFGLSVFTVKAALDDDSISVKDIFAGSWRFVVGLMLAVAIVAAFPWLATGLL